MFIPLRRATKHFLKNIWLTEAFSMGSIFCTLTPPYCYIKKFLHQNWSIWWCLVCSFLPILKQNFCWFFSRVLTTKYFILHRFKIDPQKGFFYTPHPWGKSTKVFFQKWQKTAYQTKLILFWWIWWSFTYQFIQFATKKIRLFFSRVYHTQKATFFPKFVLKKSVILCV